MIWTESGSATVFWSESVIVSGPVSVTESVIVIWSVSAMMLSSENL